MRGINKFITKVYVALFFCMLSGGIFAQLQMTRSVFTAPFVPLGLGSVSSTVAINGIENAVPMSFNFNYLGTNFSSINLCSKGWASFGATVGSTPSNEYLYTAAAPNNTLAPWWDDLSLGDFGSVIYQTQGAIGSRTFTVQWDKMLSLPGSLRSLTFQLILYEGSNVIEFCYDSNTPGAFNI
jgi:hypothetical protein